MPTSETVSRVHMACTAWTPGSASRACWSAVEPTSPGEGTNTGAAPVTSASRPVSRVACIWTSGLPTPPTTWTTLSTTWVRLGRITSTAASRVALHEDTPMTSPPISVVSR